ncbi:hypothetical protein AAG570_007850 [Ranatra chinensis]|uniref:Pre-rRNA-processing protein TSR2 homolog n=1 Tax=Ranatra chinensis TaxID=642074 RepID=A0ABD0XT11_9HEMI
MYKIYVDQHHYIRFRQNDHNSGTDRAHPSLLTAFQSLPLAFVHIFESGNTGSRMRSQQITGQKVICVYFLAWFFMMESSYDLTFDCVIGTILNNWTGLKMAIEHGMAGTEDVVVSKLTKMFELITQFLCYSEKKGAWDNFVLSDLLSDIMDTDYDTILEDNSADEIAADIIQFHQLWLTGDKVGINARLANMKYNLSILRDTTQVESPTSGGCRKLEMKELDEVAAAAAISAATCLLQFTEGRDHYIPYGQCLSSEVLDMWEHSPFVMVLPPQEA